jgi:predicted metalloprotease with PDZ domain
VAESSFDAWIKYYRQDENAPNAVVSYYVKGSLVALCLDLLIRKETGGRKSLDHVMRALWKRHGLKGIGVEENGIEKLAEEVTGLKLKRFFDHALRGTSDLPLEHLLASVGIDTEIRRAESSADKGGKRATKPEKAMAQRVDLGIRTTDNDGDLKITHVLDGGAAQKAGLAAGDTIVALDELRVTPKSFEGRLGSYRPGETVQVHAFRRDELMVLNVTLAAPLADTCVLTVNDDRSAATLRRRWLGRV